MKEIVAALRSAACFDVPPQTQKTLRALADRVEAGPDWPAVVSALLVKYGGREGTALIGGGTIAWARDRVEVVTDRDGDALRFAWRAPSLTELPAREDDR